MPVALLLCGLPCCERAPFLSIAEDNDVVGPSRARTARKSTAGGEAGTSRRRQSTRTPAVPRAAAEEEAAAAYKSDGAGLKSRGTAPALARGRKSAAAAAAAGEEAGGRTPRAATAKKGTSRQAAA